METLRVFVLGAIYFAILTPTRAAMALLRIDPFGARIRGSTSAWRERRTAMPDAQTLRQPW